LVQFKTISNVTPTRYYDWAITTPTMLLTLIAYLMYVKQPDMNLDMLYQEWLPMGIVVVLNGLMLWCGYLGEIGQLPVVQSVALGFLPFVLYFYIIYDRYVTTQSSLFYYFVVVWALYGVAAVMPYGSKNAAYNVLDLFSKNFFGLFLGYLIYSKN
jgi:bacteriorhodopsin